jgi:hypothetical protein
LRPWNDSGGGFHGLIWRGAASGGNPQLTISAQYLPDIEAAGDSTHGPAAP